MSFRDFRNALRMTFLESRAYLWIFLVIPLAFTFFFKAAGDGFLYILLYIFPLLACQKAPQKESHLAAFPLEFSLTRPLSRPALHAAQTLHPFFLLFLIAPLLVLEASLFHIHLQDFPCHLILIATLISLYQALLLMLWPFPKLQLGILRVCSVLFPTAASFAHIWAGTALFSHPLFIPTCATLIAIAQTFAYRAFIRQEILS
ncbi:hypothetical protein SAMN05444156_0252 [Verrucomicrobium sp. GAS474]|uniref:hypothetical protein n=1 Tax=Verrucomicrobium sp. GAS474 TaxID=1882831 RepID=UPI00087B98C4|nr:hypothetical protein [Verrucomicrobium sp. GAS474]SDT86944.1 hypothetical protein SAMN05444156_0252 [Verrucomicrobium sp. GAS474]